MENQINSEEFVDTEDSSDIEELMLTIAWKDYDYVFDDKKSAENKAIILLASCGVFLGILTTTINSINPILRPYAFLFLIGSMLLGIYALKFREYKYLRTMSIWESFEEKNYLETPTEAKNALFQYIGEINDENRENYSEIVKYTLFSQYAFALGAIITIIGLLYPKICIC